MGRKKKYISGKGGKRKKKTHTKVSGRGRRQFVSRRRAPPKTGGPRIDPRKTLRKGLARSEYGDPIEILIPRRGGGFFGSIWSGIKKGAEAVADTVKDPVGSLGKAVKIAGRVTKAVAVGAYTSATHPKTLVKRAIKMGINKMPYVKIGKRVFKIVKGGPGGLKDNLKNFVLEDVKGTVSGSDIVELTSGKPLAEHVSEGVKGGGLKSVIVW